MPLTMRMAKSWNAVVANGETIVLAKTAKAETALQRRNVSHSRQSAVLEYRLGDALTFRLDVRASG
jgi:hypothetical protein